jgi:hypothetical protein
MKTLDSFINQYRQHDDIYENASDKVWNILREYKAGESFLFLNTEELFMFACFVREAEK